jgi:hypothetical protein
MLPHCQTVRHNSERRSPPGIKRGRDMHLHAHPESSLPASFKSCSRFPICLHRQTGAGLFRPQSDGKQGASDAWGSLTLADASCGLRAKYAYKENKCQLIRPKTLRLKKRSPRTRLSKPSRNPLPRWKTNRTLHQKSKVSARVRSQYPKPTRTTGTTFLERRKSDSTWSTGRDLRSRGSFSVVGRWSVLGEAPLSPSAKGWCRTRRGGGGSNRSVDSPVIPGSSRLSEPLRCSKLIRSLRFVLSDLDASERKGPGIAVGPFLLLCLNGWTLEIHTAHAAHSAATRRHAAACVLLRHFGYHGLCSDQKRRD